ncbi:hypothetical protein L2E82_11060 [Cichorium intybus]|uniref:Uncharacterized protein n=1 Tax=Cichorium intybus TaxID=13427 RepID=A0ACB9GDH5_CICIN|nr:hypothetical protein L2E82_11060 [Cichorium intybus]
MLLDAESPGQDHALDKFAGYMLHCYKSSLEIQKTTLGETDHLQSYKHIDDQSYLYGVADRFIVEDDEESSPSYSLLCGLPIKLSIVAINKRGAVRSQQEEKGLKRRRNDEGEAVGADNVEAF